MRNRTSDYGAARVCKGINLRGREANNTVPNTSTSGLEGGRNSELPVIQNLAPPCIGMHASIQSYWVSFLAEKVCHKLNV